MIYDPTAEGWSGARDPVALERPVAAADLAGARGRVKLAAAFCVAGFAVLGVRAAQVALTVEAPHVASAQASASAALKPVRAEIVDRNGELLAGAITTYDLYANTKAVWDPADMAKRIAAELPDIDPARLTERLQRSKGYVLVKRDLTPRQRQAIFRLGIPAVQFNESERRIYPRGGLAAHVLGFVDSEGKGRSGVERALDERILSIGAQGGKVQLTLDLRVQYALEAELASTAAEFDAKGGAGVVMDVTNGEIIGLASWPAFDPNAPGESEPDAMRNRAAGDVYEMGSTFKPLTVAMGLDSGKVTLNDGYDTSAPLTFGKSMIRDVHPFKGVQSIAQILTHSSNIGAARLALDLGAPTQERYLRGFGLLDPVPLQTGDLGRPLLPQSWAPVNTATIGFGHGIAVSPVALTAAYAALANGGVRIAPTITPRSPDDPAPTNRVVSAETAREVVGLMRRVVTDGTGKLADASGYEVAGKTGSAEKAGLGGYDHHRLLSSFAAVFPASEPRYAVLILLDEPKAVGADGNATAAITAAPSVGRLVQRIAPLLGVKPVLEGPPPGVAIQSEEAKRSAG